MTQELLQSWLQANCPTFWSILNQNAKRCLPPGIVEYMSEGNREIIEEGRRWLQIAEKHLVALVTVCGSKAVGDAYRRDLSGVSTGKQLAELLCEVALCASVSKLSPMPPRLRPPSGRGTYCDISVQLNGFTVFGEAKRYEDTWFSDLDPARPESRSLVKAPLGDKPHENSKPRYMDLSSKLKDVPRQFPAGTINLLFIFHSSPGDSRGYVQQALFGENTRSMKPDEVDLEPDGLFSTEEWQVVSGCYLTQVSTHGALVFPVTWDNPNADVPIPEAVHFVLDQILQERTKPKPKKGWSLGSSFRDMLRQRERGIEESTDLLSDEIGAREVVIGEDVEDSVIITGDTIPDPSTVLEAEMKKLVPGQVLFNAPEEMKVGVKERIEVRIAKNFPGDLTKGLKGRGIPVFEEIRVNTLMKVRLRGENFHIEILSHEEQLVADAEFTQWDYDVTPLKSGTQELLLTVTVRIKVPDYGEEKRDYPVYDKQIKVEANRLFSLVNFIKNNWKWLVGVITGSGIIGWIVKWWVT